MSHKSTGFWYMFFFFFLSLDLQLWNKVLLVKGRHKALLSLEVWFNQYSTAKTWSWRFPWASWSTWASSRCPNRYPGGSRLALSGAPSSESTSVRLLHSVSIQINYTIKMMQATGRCQWIVWSIHACFYKLHLCTAHTIPYFSILYQHSLQYVALSPGHSWGQG